MATFSTRLAHGAPYVDIIYDVWQISQDIPNNRTLVGWQASLNITSGSRTGGWDWNAYLDGVYVGGGSISPSNWSGVHVLGSGSAYITHDAAGNRWVGGSSYLDDYYAQATASGGITLTPIPRYSEYINGTPYAESITRQGFSVRVASALTFDNVATSLDGAGWVYWPGDSTNKAIAMATGLNSGTTHTFKTSLRNKSSQLWRESGTVNVTLSKQAITTFTASDISDVGFNINVVVDDTCDDLQISLDGGAYVSHPGDFTTKTLAIGGNLSSGVVHTIKARTHAKVSGAYVESSQIDVSTLPQNKFINFFDDRFGKGE